MYALYALHTTSALSERLSSLLLEIGRATRAEKEAHPSFASVVDGQHRMTGFPSKASIEFTHSFATCLTRQLYSKISHQGDPHPISILRISKLINYANRTLVSAYCEIGRGLKLYETDSFGRAVLITVTPTFDIWEDLAEKRFKRVISVVNNLSKELVRSPREVRHSISELKQAFFIAQTLERDLMAKRRYEILATSALEAMMEPDKTTKLGLRDIANKLELMQEMGEVPSETLLEGFNVKEHEGRVTIEWTGSGSEASRAEKSSRAATSTTSTGK